MSDPPGKSAFESIYRRYKNDTEHIAGWLNETAKACGYQAIQPQAPTRLKGKARKEAKANESSNTAGPGPKYIIKASDFVPMARTIAASEPRMDVPRALQKLLARAIRGRKSAAEFFGGGNRGHSHFVTVLEAALGILTPLVAVPAESSHGQFGEEAQPPNGSFSTNYFAELTVEDTTDDEAEIQQLLPRITPVPIQQDESDIEQEFFWAILCFFDQANVLRDCIKDTWEDYRNGIHDLVVTSILTNVAMEFVQQAELELERELEFDLIRPKKYPAKDYPVGVMPLVLFDRIATGENEDEMLDYCFASTYKALELYSISFQTAMKMDYNPKGGTPFARLPENKRGWPNDTHRANEWIQIYRVANVVTYESENFVQDNVTRSVKKIFETRTVPFWTTFCIQILLDIEDCLGDALSRGFDEVHSHVRTGLDKWHRHKLTRLHRSPNKIVTIAYRAMDIVMGGYKKWVLDDYVGDKIRANRDIAEHGVFKGQPIERDFFLKRHPMRCGLIKYDFTWHLNASGLGIENLTRNVHLLTHVYAAGQLLHPDARSWPDLELAIYRQDPAELFFGGRPQSLREAKTKFDLALGGSVVNAAKNRRPGAKKLNNPKNARPFRVNSVIAELFVQQRVDLLRKSKSPDPFVPRLVQFLSEKKNYVEVGKQLNRPDDEIEEFAQEHLTNPGKVPPIPKMLEVLVIWLYADALDLYFDWNSLEYTCAEIWARIIDEVGDGQRTPQQLASAALEEAKKCEDDAKTGSKGDAEIKAPLLRKMWNIMQDCIQKETRSEGGFKSYVADTCLLGLKDINGRESPIGNMAHDLGGFCWINLYKNWEVRDTIVGGREVEGERYEVKGERA